MILRSGRFVTTLVRHFASYFFGSIQIAEECQIERKHW